MKIPPSNGPSTVVTPKTAPSIPWYRPRSRSGMTSPISAVAVTVSPPAPSPWIARAAISHSIDCAAPLSAEPITNTTIDTWKTILRPNRSPSLPTTAVITVSASRYEVTTHD